MLNELDLSGIVDFLTNSNDLMSWEGQAAYLSSEYKLELNKASKLVRVFQTEFALTPIVLGDVAIRFIAKQLA